MVDVFIKEDPYLSDVLVQVITKSGVYLNKSQARHLIVDQRVIVGNELIVDPARILPPGCYSFRVNNNVYDVCIRLAETE